jgi:hypothetical protein
MGYIRHEAIIVIDHGYSDGIEKAHKVAATVLAKHSTLSDNFVELLSPIVSSVINGYRSFFIAPDGSKKGWTTADAADEARAEIIEWLKARRTHEYGYLDFVAVAGFGGDDNDPLITASSTTQEADVITEEK